MARVPLFPVHGPGPISRQVEQEHPGIIDTGHDDRDIARQQRPVSGLKHYAIDLRSTARDMQP